MNQESWIYLAQLTRALQMEGVDGRRAGEFVAEIDSHLAETGVDPVEEFGTPFDLASDLARRPGSRRPGWVPPMWAMWVVALLVTVAFVAAVDAVILGWDRAGVPLRARGVVWIAVFFSATMAFSYAATRNLSGRAWTALTGGRAALAIFAVAAVTTTASSLAGDRVVTRIPVIAFWVGVAVVVPLATLIVIRRNNPVRFPDNARHLDRLRRGLFAGRPPRESAGNAAGM